MPLFHLERKHSLSGLHYIVSTIYLCLLLYLKDEEMLRGRSCDRLSFIFFASCSDFTFSPVIENGKFCLSSGVFYFFTGPIIHDIHLCLPALTPTDQSLTGHECGSATECRLNSIIMGFGDEGKQNSSQDGFPPLFTAFEEIGTKSRTVTTTFKECIC